MTVNEDLKFIPLNIKKQFIEKNSTWIPLIDGEDLQIENLNENFLMNFENNINNFSLEQRNIKVLDNTDENKMIPNIKKQKFEEDFNLEYPSETYEEELYSYNNEGCKKTNNNNLNYSNENKMNNNYYKDNNLNYYNYDNDNYNNNSYKSNNNNNYKDDNMKNNKTYNKNEEFQDKNKLIEVDYYKELIHMSLLREVDFNLNIDNNLRNNKNLNLKIDEIFNKIKGEESIVETFKVYNVPKPISDLVIKKIIKIALENYEYK